MEEDGAKCQECRAGSSVTTTARKARTRLRLFFSPLIMSLLLVPRLSGFVERRPITAAATKFAEAVETRLRDIASNRFPFFFAELTGVH